MVARKSRWTKAVFASLASLFGSSRNQPSYRRRLFLESLEDRCLPTTITPTTFADGVLGSGSLRDAVIQFNADTGSGDDIINLLAGTYALTIVNSGGHHETAGLEGDLNITSTSHRLIIQGAGSSGANVTIVDASQMLDRVFEIVNPGTRVVFQDLVIQGGLAQDDGSNGALAGSTDALGGGILNNSGDVTLDHLVVHNNVARGGDVAVLSGPGHNARGGGVYSTGGALTIAEATIANNQVIGGRGGDIGGFRAGNGGSASGGGLYATGGSLDISNSMIASNMATGGRGGDGSHSSGSSNTRTGNGGIGGTAQGGGLYVNGSSLTIATSTIASNQGTGGAGSLYGFVGNAEGGAMYNGGTLAVSNSTLSGNSANGSYRLVAAGGGGIYNIGTLTVSNSTLSANSDNGSFGFRARGGGIYNMGALTVSNSTLSNNSGSYGDGGGISNSGTLTVSNTTLSGNYSGGFIGGGGILNFATLTVSNSTLSGNSAYGYGGGIANYRMLTVSNSTLSGNSATHRGGGLYNEGTLTVSSSTLSANNGSGLYNEGTLTVSNSTLSGNIGSGIVNFGTLTVSNSTLSGNSAYGYGGGIWTYSNQSVTLTNVTVTANRANLYGLSYQGGGVFVSSGSPVLHNTLIAGNFRGATGTTRDDVSGALNASGDYNLIGDGTGMTGLSHGVNGNLVGSAAAPIDPLLGPLQDNGGPTKTHALLAGSPALNAGNPFQLGVADQRGVVRTGGVNIGAYQASASAFVVTVPGTVAAVMPFDVTVQAVDIFGQVAFGYRGTVTFSVTDPDPAVMLPADYTFTADDQGTHTFTGEFTLITPGMWTLTTADLANGLSQDVMVTVDP
jgi:hypothetical protein